jgi:hypothetical protein
MIWGMPPDSNKIQDREGDMTKEERHTHWRKIIEGQRTSGMTIVAYCRKTIEDRGIFTL